MKMGLRKVAFVLSVAAFLSITSRAQSQIVFWDFDFGFDPTSVVVNPGGTVTFANYDIYGFDVNISGPGFSMFLGPFESQGVIFPNSGDYSFQSDYGDRGSVHVNFPPSVTITNPLDGATLPAQATFAVEATASDPDDVVWQVEFYLQSIEPTNQINLDFDAPYDASITNLAAGEYKLIAVAEDYYFLRATNSITITVGAAVPITLTEPKVGGDKFSFAVTGLTVGRTNVLQCSTNLTSWTGIATNVAASTSASITNTVLPGMTCYRLVQLP